MTLLIIGCGPGGYHTAEYAAKHGIEVTIIEQAHAGGTCLNCGCIPTKSMCHDAEVADMVSAYTGEPVTVNMEAVIQRKNNVISQLRSGVETLMSAPGITLVWGRAVLKDAHTVTVYAYTDDGKMQPEGTDYSADNIIIATGSHPKMPPIAGIDTTGVITSTELLDINHIPARLCIVGAGVIGMEFASIFNSFGSEVTVVEYLKECLPIVDSDIAKRLRKLLEKRGINFVMQSAVKSIAKTSESLSLTYERKGKEAVLEADTILVATGRAANVEGLGLETVGIDTSRSGIVVDDNMQTSVVGIYAIGDVNGLIMLAHAASAQGVKCVNHILGIKDSINLDIMPSAVFTTPEVASVGMSEDTCRTKGIEYTVRKSFYRSNGKALTMDATEGMVKLMLDADNKIIGCHAYGAHAADLIQEVTAIMHFGGTYADLHHIIHTHPTLSEVLLE